MEKGHDADHVTADLVGELCHLFSDVLEKGVGFPSSKEHDHVRRGAGEDHGHGCCGTT